MRKVKPGKIPKALDGAASDGGREIESAVTFFADAANADNARPARGTTSH